MHEKLSYISGNIRSHRVRIGYSQEQMADKLGVSRATYNRYETNPDKLNVKTLRKISALLGCDIADFFVKFNVTNSDIRN